ncbi:hypothetical protein B0J11DRAFT_27382 [Dendryphion nanum]|uniref:DNA (cytosine-5)-methyltransferase 1 replication foci domain-containing protein n=1 Tax=Dendryphion nanum TaxID=256645 RepID=A0A9P9EKQ1_9PLEO|nr:hypothetical protein B0J11DRAFT_27382 [Dendryphion nanum]
MASPELDILKPIDASITNSDDFEIFTLSNASVFHKNGKTASLLHAYADTPLRVEGRLEAPDRSQTKYLVKKPFKPIEIEIRNVTRFSYGQTQDGETVIWALGAAGWFELRPSRSYKETFDDMVQAVEILYFITDIYNEPRKRGGGPSAQLIFQEYAEDERFACNDVEQAGQIFYKHRAFLYMCFLNKAQGIGWSNTPIYQYYKRQYPKDWEKAKARTEGKALHVNDKNVKTTAGPPKAIASRSRAKPKPKSAEKEAPKKDENWWEAAAIFEFMQKAVNQRAMHIGNITLERVAKLLVKRYEIENVDVAKQVILVHATNLCYIMDHPRRKSIQFFASEPIYEELCAHRPLSAAEIRKAESVGLKPRRDRPSLKEDNSEQSDEEPSELETPQRRPLRKKKGRLSILRPKSSKYSGKGKSVNLASSKEKGKAPIVAAYTDDEMEDPDRTTTQSESDSESDVGVDTPTQISSPGKRKHNIDDYDHNPRKRAASSSVEPESPSTSDEGTETPTEPTLPLRYRSGNVGSKASSAALQAPPIISTSLPQYSANAADGSWTCTFDGCSRKVYGAETDVGRTLVHEHLEDHSKGRQNEIGILMAEESKLRLPVK